MTERVLRAEDTDWLRTAIASSGLGRGQQLDSVSLEGFVGTGQMSRNARFHLHWAEGDGPASVIVKMPSLDAATRTWSASTGLYARECYFYSTLAPLTGIAVPRVWVNTIDEAGGDFVLVMEDLAQSRQGDQFTEPDDGQLEMAVAQAAALHAPVWDRTGMSELQPLIKAADERAAFMADNIAQCLPICLERLGDRLETGIADLLQAFGARVGDWIRNSDVPRTIVHGDFRPDNFLWGEANTAPPLMVVDWQTYHMGAGVNDIAYLLGGALSAEKRRVVEGPLLQAYHDDLKARGVRYDVDRCQRDYARGTLYGLIVAIAAFLGMVRTERGDALFTLMLNRHGHHALDQDALALL